jgi:flagellar protein FliO/FliZ
MNDTSTALLLVRVGLSLGIVVGLILVASRVLRRRGGGSPSRRMGPSIELLERRNVGKRASIALVRVDDRRVLVGVTEHQIGLLADLGTELPEPPQELEPPIDVTSTPAIDATSSALTPVGPLVSVPADNQDGTGGSPDGTGMLVADLTDSRFPLGTTPTRPPKLSLVQAVRELTVRRH